MEAAAKTLNRGDRPAPTIADPASSPATTLEAEERAGVDREHGAAERMIPRQAIAECVREREHPLAHGNMRQDVVDELRGAGGHATAATTRTKTAALAREGHERFGVTPLALKPREAAAPDATLQEPAELLLEERGEAGGIRAGGSGEKRLQVFAHHLMEHGAFGLAGRIAQGGNGRAAFAACGGLARHEPRSWQPRVAAHFSE